MVFGRLSAVRVEYASAVPSILRGRAGCGGGGGGKEGKGKGGEEMEDGLGLVRSPS